MCLYKGSCQDERPISASQFPNEQRKILYQGAGRGMCSKKPPSSKHEEVARLTPQRQAALRALVAVARLAIALERRNTGGTVASVAVLHDESSVVLVVTPSESPEGGLLLQGQRWEHRRCMACTTSNSSSLKDPICPFPVAL